MSKIFFVGEVSAKDRRTPFSIAAGQTERRIKQPHITRLQVGIVKRREENIADIHIFGSNSEPDARSQPGCPVGRYVQRIPWGTRQAVPRQVKRAKLELPVSR